jgi:hypothetical protein
VLLRLGPRREAVPAALERQGQLQQSSDESSKAGWSTELGDWESAAAVAAHSSRCGSSQQLWRTAGRSLCSSSGGWVKQLNLCSSWNMEHRPAAHAGLLGRFMAGQVGWSGWHVQPWSVRMSVGVHTCGPGRWHATGTLFEPVVQLLLRLLCRRLLCRQVGCKIFKQPSPRPAGLSCNQQAMLKQMVTFPTCCRLVPAQGTHGTCTMQCSTVAACSGLSKPAACHRAA